MWQSCSIPQNNISQNPCVLKYKRPRLTTVFHKLLTLGGQCYLPPIEFVCPERDSNPHSHFWPKDFKSFVSTIPPSGLTDFAVQK